MSDDLVKQEKSLIRCLERLHDLAKTEPFTRALAALYYTATLLDQFLSKDTNQTKTRYYFELFEREFNLILRASAPPSHSPTLQQRNSTEIMLEIAQIIQRHNHFNNEIKESEEVKKLLQEKKEAELLELSLQKIRHFYAEHNIDEVSHQIDILTEMAITSSYISGKLQHELHNQLAKYKKQYRKMHEFYSNFETSEGWIFDKEKDNVRLEYRVYDEEKTIAVRVNGQIDIQMMPFMAIACEIDLQKEYMPFVEVSEEVTTLREKPPRNLKVGFSLTSVPFLADRQCHFYAIGYDRMNTVGSIFIFTESFEDDKSFQQRFDRQIEESGDKVFLKVYYFCLEYRPISKSRAQIRIVTKVDFKLSFLPLFIVTASARIFTFNYFENIVKRAKNFKGSKWEAKVKSNPDMYNFFQSKIDEYFGQKLD